MHYIQVALPVPLRQTFTYCSSQPIAVGCRVWVPFGRRKLVGVVVATTINKPGDFEAKEIDQLIDSDPIFTEVVFTLCQWLASYYHHPIGEVLHSAIPVLLRKGESATPTDTEVVTIASDAPDNWSQQLTRAPKQLACMQAVYSGETDPTALRRDFGASVVNTLQQKTLLTIETRPWKSIASAINFATYKVNQANLNADREQALAIATVSQKLNQFAPFLLEGVTGSGKTEVYLQCIEQVLANDQQVLILIPEIGLTPQTLARFQQRFTVPIGVLHSQVNNTQRLHIWHQAKQGQLGIVIGTRSAIFTPMARLGMIIVDEEHDESFKQQDGLRYHARDTAVKRAQLDNVPLILGSATPSLESLNNALQKRYFHLHLTKRAGGAQTTNQIIYDARDQLIEDGIAEGLLSVMERHLSLGNQVMVFLNRRGFATALVCHHCGHTPTCQRCEQPYTLHKSNRTLQCHHCGASRRIMQQCEQCHSSELIMEGSGTERIEHALAKHFPHAKQVRIDSDSIRGKGRLQGLLEDINHQRYQILIGTQILSKGHHFPHVTLVVVLGCDGALFSADFRAPEKLAQLVTQLAGRAGRAQKKGEMWLQTHNPGHVLLQDLINNGYSHFARHALQDRKLAQLPPYSAQALIRAEAQNKRHAYDFLHAAATLLAPAQQLNLLGPLPCFMEKKQGRFRFVLVLSSPQKAPIHHALNHHLAPISVLPLASKVRWSVDIDPIDFS